MSSARPVTALVCPTGFRLRPGPNRRPVIAVLKGGGLAPGATAHSILRYGDVTVATAPGCHPTFSTFELRIYPPGQRRATYAAFDLEACSHAGPVYLGVEPIRPGAGTISG